MSTAPAPVTLSQARSLLRTLAAEHAVLLLSPPGLGKSDLVRLAAADAGLPVRSLLGTQIAPEDVSGIPRIVGERAVFCPPRVLLPEEPIPFCLFLDELPAASIDVQKALYSVLLERRIGEHALPAGTWVVAAGNEVDDRAFVRNMSSALINRLFVLHLRVDVNEWLQWGSREGLRSEVLAFVAHQPEALLRRPGPEQAPFSTPRAWASLARALDQVEAAGVLDDTVQRTLAFGRVSAEDAALFCSVDDRALIHAPLEHVLSRPLPTNPASRWYVLKAVRRAIANRDPAAFGLSSATDARPLNELLSSLSLEEQCCLVVGLVDDWVWWGAAPALLEALRALLQGPA